MTYDIVCQGWKGEDRVVVATGLALKEANRRCVASDRAARVDGTFAKRNFRVIPSANQELAPTVTQPVVAKPPTIATFEVDAILNAREDHELVELLIGLADRLPLSPRQCKALHSWCDQLQARKV